MKADTLLDCYRGIYNQPQRWLYYAPSLSSTSITTRYPTIDKVLKSDENANDFVHLYLCAGLKGSIIDKMPNITFRYAHAVSTFFLGIYLKNIFKLGPLDQHFLYLWFLTCLLHDADYEEEKVGNAKSLRHFYNLHSIEFDLFLDIHTFRCKGLDENLIKNYFNYRLYACHKMDHGICGGVILYDALRRQYNDYEKSRSRVGRCDTPRESFVYGNLLWSRKHWSKYASCAYAIAQHNIWAADETNISDYMNFDLNQLTGKITYKTKLTALLVLCDTIEPIKAFEKCQCPIDTLSNLQIKKSQNSINIKLYHVCGKNNCYSTRVMPLENWTNIQVKNDYHPTFCQEIGISQLTKLYHI